jgi:hypothetical protein
MRPMLHNTRTQAEFDSITEASIKAEYKKSGDIYVLQHDEDVGALKRAKDRESAKVTELTTDLRKVESERDGFKAAAEKTGSPAQIADAARTTALAEVKPKLDRADRLESSLKSTALETAALDIAKQIGGDKNAKALLPHVTGRIEVTLGDDDKPVIVIKDSAGKATKLTPADLTTELRSNKDLSSLVVVSRATGAAVGDPHKQPGFVQSPAGGAGKKFSEMTSAERVAALAPKVEAIT